MQTVSSAFTAEASSLDRQVTGDVLVSWKKRIIANTIFTIGVSTIGGNDFIPGSTSIQSLWSRYEYEDESENIINLGFERTLDLPEGGVSKSLADVLLDNTSGRYLPDYMGGDGSLSTSSIEPGKPLIINTGFEIGGVSETVPQFVGVLHRQPQVSVRNKLIQLNAVDFLEYTSNIYVDDTSMFTNTRSDVLVENILTQLGFGTSDYELDVGQQVIPFGIIEAGSKFVDIIDKVVSAENGHFYQDEQGKLIFQNYLHWASAPTDYILTTSEVIEAESPNEDSIVNVVEVRANPRQATGTVQIFALEAPLELTPGSNDVWVNFDNPVLAASTPVRTANSESDGGGVDDTASVTLTSTSVFAQAAKYIYNNATGRTSYLTSLTIQGRWALPIYPNGIYYRQQDDSSVTAFQEQPLVIDNDYIQSQTWAESFAQIVLDQFAEVKNLQRLTIKAQPQLQLTDIISWQGRQWIIYGIKLRLDPNTGFLQELNLLQKI